MTSSKRSNAAFRRARRAFLEADPGSSYALVLLLSGVAFLMAAQSGRGWRFMAAVILVLVLHELGHALAMRTLGYRNVRVFLIPFFGAATSGVRSSGVSAMREAIVLLAGPVPGLALGCALRELHFSDWSIQIWMHTFAGLLIGINAFNLLPVLPLDGGRLVNLALLKQKPFFEAVFAMATGVGVGVWSFLTRDWAFLAVGVFTAFGAFGGENRAEVARALRERHGTFPAEPDALSEAALADLYVAALGLVEQQLPRGTKRKNQAAARVVANSMRAIHERASYPETTLGASALILTCYASTLAMLGLIYL